MILSNAQHIGRREDQQDAFGFSGLANRRFLGHAGVLAVLADGVGSLSHGATAAQTAVKALIAAYEAKTRKESVPDALARALGQANAAVLLSVRAAGVEGNAATTIVAVVLHGDRLHWISAGDSRAYLIRRGRTHRLSTDHVLSAKPGKGSAGTHVGAAETPYQPGPDAVTSFLGASAIPETDRSLRPLALAPGDLVLLCSDGLYRAVDERAIAEEAVRGGLRHACERLVGRVMSRALPDQDNVTVLMIAADPGHRDVVSRAWRRVLGWVGLVVVLLAITDVALMVFVRPQERKKPKTRASEPGDVPGARLARPSPSG